MPLIQRHLSFSALSPSIVAPSPRWCAAMLVLAVSMPAVLGQDRSADRQAQIDALDAHVARLEPPATPEELVEFSRLLSEPEDQINWLIAQVTRLAESRRADAVKLRDLTDQRIDAWTARGVASVAALKEALAAACPAELPIAEVLDPEELKARLVDRLNVAELTDADKFRLLARGVPSSKLGVRGTGRAGTWDVPRVVLQRLASGSEHRLPAMWELLDQDRSLREAATATANQTDLPPHVAETFDIARALLDRAMGITDGQTTSDTWKTLADTLSANSADAALWEWAAAARLLQAATTPTAEARTAVFAQAREHLAPASTVAATVPNDTRSLASALGAWLARADEPTSPPAASGLLPLQLAAPAANQTRAAAEAELARLWPQAQAGDERALNNAFAQMQYAKLREIGLPDGTPLTIADVQKQLCEPHHGAAVPGVHLFLETVVTASGDYYGLAVRAAIGSFSSQDSWEVKVVGPVRSRSELFAAALPEKERLSKGQFVVAPDGPGRVGKELEDTTSQLVAFIEPSDSAFGDEANWLVYVPSAAAMAGDSPWTLETALRLWYRTLRAQSSAGAATMLGRLPQTGEPGHWRLDSPLPDKLLFMTLAVGSEYPTSLRYTPDGKQFRHRVMIGLKAGEVPPNVILLGARLTP
ncbi:MAG: hypothetical protein PVJ57_09010 [Phycisphaerae bacterium]|jgi:hypothetical protein